LIYLKRNDMKNFKGKAIYNPSGKAGEYSYWACNFYVGCSHGCTYCYCKKGILAKAMGQKSPQLKKCFIDGGYHKKDRSIYMLPEDYALYIFKLELEENIQELKKHGLFFSFTTDPMLTETIELTLNAADISTELDVPVKILTKCTKWVDKFIENSDTMENAETGLQTWKKYWAFGFTLTGHDELEPGASTNQERIEAMIKLHNAGFKTFASIEPIIDIDSSYEMILLANNAGCDLFKIGLEAGKEYNKTGLLYFMMNVIDRLSDKKVYFKDSLLKQAGITRNKLTENCVGRDYNLFE